MGRCRKVKSEGTKGRESVVGKAVGDECVFILAKGRQIKCESADFNCYNPRLGSSKGAKPA
jgi:hypothetical protein